MLRHCSRARRGRPTRFRMRTAESHDVYVPEEGAHYPRRDHEGTSSSYRDNSPGLKRYTRQIACLVLLSRTILTSSITKVKEQATEISSTPLAVHQSIQGGTTNNSAQWLLLIELASLPTLPASSLMRGNGSKTPHRGTSDWLAQQRDDGPFFNPPSSPTAASSFLHRRSCYQFHSMSSSPCCCY